MYTEGMFAMSVYFSLLSPSIHCSCYIITYSFCSILVVTYLNHHYLLFRQIIIAIDNVDVNKLIIVYEIYCVVNIYISLTSCEEPCVIYHFHFSAFWKISIYEIHIYILLNGNHRSYFDRVVDVVRHVLSVILMIIKLH